MRLRDLLPTHASQAVESMFAVLAVDFYFASPLAYRASVCEYLLAPPVEKALENTLVQH